LHELDVSHVQLVPDSTIQQSSPPIKPKQTRLSFSYSSPPATANFHITRPINGQQYARSNLESERAWRKHVTHNDVIKHPNSAR